MRFLVPFSAKNLSRVGFAVVLSLFGANVAAQQTQRIVQTTENADYFGFDYRTVKDVTEKQCAQACVTDQQCKAFTFNQSANWCFLKDEAGELQSAEGAIAGRIVAKTVREPDSFNNPAELQFVTKDLVRALDALRSSFAANGIKGDVDNLPGRFSAAALVNDFPAMRRSATAWVTVDPLSLTAWQSYADTYWRSRSDKWQQTRDYRSFAISGALETYRLAQDDAEKAAALDLLARTLVLSDRYRPALEAYKMSLSLADEPFVRAAYEELDANHGFRMLDYSVDSDAATPGACVQFSEKLDADGTEYTDYMRLNGAEPTDVRVSNKEICVGGLTHGERYRLDLRAGLPAEIGERIDDVVTLDIYVRDRSPNVRFSGSSYVLSRSHAKGIPLVTVNMDAVDVSLHRVGDAAVAELLRGGKFNRPLNNDSLDNLSIDLATPVWSGVLETDGKLNEDTTSLVPVFRMIGDLQPGAYVMVADGPKTNESYWQPKATQWFVVSDLGLSTLSADDGLHAFARSLETSAPMQGVAVKLIARNSEVLARGKTDADGYVRFAPGLLRGEGALQASTLVAETDAPDYALLDLELSGFDLTDRGVDGRTSPGAVDAFLYTERGVYRPGAEVYATALLRDGSAEALTGLPVTFVLNRPDGVEQIRSISTNDSTGGHSASFVLPVSALRGSWDIQVFTDPDASPVATKRFLVEDFLPERIDYDLTLNDEVLRAGDVATMSVAARYLFGAPAAGLPIEGNISIVARQPLDGPYRGFVFGLSDENFTPVNDRFTPGVRTDADGRGQFDISVPSVPDTTLPLSARISVTVSDGGGRPVERQIEAPLAATGPSIGIRPLFDGSAPENSSAGFQLVALDDEGTQIDAEDTSYELKRINRSYQWYRKSNGKWGWEPITRTDQIATGSVSLMRDQLARLDLNVEWGSYRLEVVSGDAVASYDFYAGWYVEKSAFDTPDALQVGIDRSEYAAGEVAKVRLSADRPGKLQLLVANEELLARYQFEVSEGDQSFDVPVGENWGAGAYVLATLHHPMDIENGQLPTRSIGVEWLGINPEPRTLSVAMELPEKIKPRTTLSVPVKVSGLVDGSAHIVVSAVDLGILNLTRYTPPEPEKWYFAKRQLGATLRDLYGRLINGLTGNLGRLRVGGDAATAGLAMEGNPPSEQPVSLYSGIVDLDENGEATISFDVPQFNGTLKLMAVAWSEMKLGSANAEVIVRDPVVMTTTLPRFLAPGDKSRLLVQFDNTDGPAGDYDLTVTASHGLDIGDNAAGIVALETGGNAKRLIPLTATAVGIADLNISLTGPDGQIVRKDLVLPLRANTRPLHDANSVVLTPSSADGNSFTINESVLEAYVPGTATVSVALGAGAGLNPAALYNRLDRYAYRCSEQTTSRALPLLSRTITSATDRKTIEEAITRLVSYQTSAGSFGLWGAGASRDLWLDAYVSDFLTRAREAGYEVPDVAFEQAINNLKNTLSFSTNIDADANPMAYALYVLARNGSATLGDLRYFVDAKFDAFSTPIAKAQLAAGLALYGEKARAATAFEAAKTTYMSARKVRPWRSGPRDFGTNLRDGAAVMSLIAESGLDQIETTELAEAVTADRQRDRYLSTQEMAWLLMASGSLAKANDTLDVDVSHAGVQLEKDASGDGSGVISFSFDEAAMAEGNVVLRNNLQRSVPLRVATSGVPKAVAEARENGFIVMREFFNRDGTPADLETLSQNDRLVVVVTVRQMVSQTDKLLLVDPLPAGFEIDNPSLLRSANSGLNWLPNSTSAEHVAFMDDRFVVGFDGKTFKEMPVTDGSNVWTFAYQVRAISPGEFTLPPTHVEDMYWPQIHGTTAGTSISVLGPLR